MSGELLQTFTSILRMHDEITKDSLGATASHDGSSRTGAPEQLPTFRRVCSLLAITLGLVYLLLPRSTGPGPRVKLPTRQTWYRHIQSPAGLCEDGENGPHQKMYAGHIGLEGDTDATPRRSFFWFFEAEKDPQDAPVVLVTAGGPGTSALVHAVFGQSACSLGPGPRLYFNPGRWNDNLNLLFLDHPIGTGYSYGVMSNNSHSAALDVYDFLQKFYSLFPSYAKNKLVLSSGSYGGIFMPHIASVLNEQNKYPKSPDRTPILLDSIMLTNPVVNVNSHFRWLLQYRCVEKQIYDRETCERLFRFLPQCLEGIDLAFIRPTLENKVAAIDFCQENIASADTRGTLLEDVRKKCYAKPTPTNPGICHSHFAAMDEYFNSSEVKAAFGVPQELEYRSLNVPVNQAFYNAGDLITEHHLLLEPLLADGVRLLVYAGAQDANCAWPGVISSLKLLRSPFQEAFIKGEDRPWAPWDPLTTDATIRSIGEGAGNLTYILIDDAGHFVIQDNPRISKLIAEHWIFNKPFFH